MVEGLLVTPAQAGLPDLTRLDSGFRRHEVPRQNGCLARTSWKKLRIGAESPLRFRFGFVLSPYGYPRPTARGPDRAVP
jgi:hypothetical protein